MQKLIAILNVIAWAGFWSFGYLALTEPPQNGGRAVVALVLAALGGALGLWAWFRLVRNAEATGFARAPQQARTGDEGRAA